MKAEEIEITISKFGSKKDESIIIKAYIVCPGIAVHRTYLWESRWTLTHIPTGKSIVTGLKTRKQAIQFAEVLLATGAKFTWKDPRKGKHGKDATKLIKQFRRVAQP